VLADLRSPRLRPLCRLRLLLRLLLCLLLRMLLLLLWWLCCSTAEVWAAGCVAQLALADAVLCCGQRPRQRPSAGPACSCRLR
jgi:hypothetical protein